jgi:NAD+ dependent glucose-6-phosphate dehydrogenase
MSVPGASDLPIVEEADEVLEDAPRTVLVTGASGNIGRKLREAWEGRYEIIPIDRVVAPDDPEVIAAELADWDESWVELFDEADAVVHLAANPSEFSPWEDLYRPNMDALANVVLAAAQAGVERFVFASSNHAMGGYREAGCSGPISADLPPRPGNPYGATKLMGERLGRCVAAAYGMTFVALRIGWVQRGENQPETLTDAGDRSIWLSNRDLVQLFTRAIEADLEPGRFIVVNGLSRNLNTRWTLAEAEQALGYVPEDGAAF